MFRWRANSMPTLSALVTTVSLRTDARALATAIVVVPPVMPTMAPSPISVAAAAAILRFWATAVPRRKLIGTSSPTSARMAPPWDRVITPWSARRARSRRIVAVDTPSSSARFSTPTAPLSSMTSIIDRRRLSRIRGRMSRAPRPTVKACSIPRAHPSSGTPRLAPRGSGGTIGSRSPAVGGRFSSWTLAARPGKRPVTI